MSAKSWCIYHNVCSVVEMQCCNQALWMKKKFILFLSNKVKYDPFKLTPAIDKTVEKGIYRWHKNTVKQKTVISRKPTVVGNKKTKTYRETQQKTKCDNFIFYTCKKCLLVVEQFFNEWKIYLKQFLIIVFTNI